MRIILFPVCLLDDIIEPRESRPKIIASLSALRDKYAPAPPRKHGNIPV
jgi:propionyl-CoA carboxylase beta chain